MARTHRQPQANRERKIERMNRMWESQVQLPTSNVPEPLPPPIEVYDDRSPGHVEELRIEAEAILAEKAASSRRPFSVQSPATDDPNMGHGLLWWTGGTLDSYIPISAYGTPKRTADLRAFALTAPFILNAESVLTKKVQSLQWTIEGGRNLAQKWQRRLNNFENGDGWDFFIARWIRSYCESDKPAIVELIRSAPRWAVDENGQLTPRGELSLERGNDKTWEIVDARVMDPTRIETTTSKEFPITYHNRHTGARYNLRPYQFMSLIDMPAIDDKLPLYGVCAVSRAVWAAQEDRMVIRFAMEKMSENPGAGLGIINASTTALRTALSEAKTERQSRGVVYYKGVIFLPVLDPSGSTKLEFLSFTDLPDGFIRSEIYNIVKEIVATSFGLDVLELGSIPGRLGTATQAKVAAAKGRTKSIGAIMQGVERAFRYKLLPESLNFSIKKHDQDEEMQRALIDQIYFENAIRYSQFAQPFVANQYLVDKGAVPNEPPYIDQDLTPRNEIVDTASPEKVDDEAESAPDAASATDVSGPSGTDTDGRSNVTTRSVVRIKITREGQITYLERPVLKSLPPVNPGIDSQSRRRAIARFNRRFPDHLDLLEAEDALEME